ncbi:hypothetical protein RQP46_008656 [Phenoliferia psychrophenolica]
MASPSFLAWNRKSEALLAITYNEPYRRVVDRSEMSTFVTPFSETQYDEYLEERDRAQSAAIQMQVAASGSLVSEAQQGNRQERMWLALSSQEQRDFMEKGLESSLKPNLRQARRKWVPEIQIEKLLERGGRAFVELMRRCVVPGGNTHSLCYVENTRFDEVAGTLAGAKSKSQRLWIELILARRHHLLFAFVGATWTTQQGMTLLGGSVTPQETLQFVREKAALIGARMSADHTKWLVCAGCMQPKGLTPERKYMACGGCAKASPPIVLHYCSKACQRTHWKGGHKNECGLQSLSHHAPTFADPAPSPADSRRAPTLSLQAQIDLNKQYPQYLYTIIRESNSGNMYSLYPRDHGDPYETQEIAKYFKLRQRAHDTMEGDAVMEFYLALRRRILPHDAEPGEQPIALELKLQVAREFNLDLDSMLEEYLERMDGAPPKFGEKILGRNPEPCSAALQRQIDANRDGDHPEATYYLFGPGTPPGGLQLYTGRDQRAEFQTLRRWAIRSRHPSLVAKLFFYLLRDLKDVNPPGFTQAALLAQFELEYEWTEEQVEYGAQQALYQHLSTNPEAKMNVSPEVFENLMRVMAL